MTQIKNKGISWPLLEKFLAEVPPEIKEETERNMDRAEKLFQETHTLREWQEIFAGNPALMYLFDNMTPPKPIQGSILEPVKVKGYIAVDEDGELWFHYVRPRIEGFGEKGDKDRYWIADDRSFEIFDIEYPGLTFKDGPVEVELTIQKV